MSKIRVSLALGTLLLLSPAWAAEKEDGPGEEDHRISPEQLPEPILKAIEARWPGAEVDAAEMEKKLFEVELTTVTGDRFEILVNAKGKMKRVDEAEKKGDEEPEDESEDEPGDD